MFLDLKYTTLSVVLSSGYGRFSYQMVYKPAKTGGNRPKSARTDGTEKFMLILPQIGKEPFCVLLLMWAGTGIKPVPVFYVIMS